eukprot:364680-Chlamydomonas_euryale.AAC.5
MDGQRRRVGAWPHFRPPSPFLILAARQTCILRSAWAADGLVCLMLSVSDAQHTAHEGGAFMLKDDPSCCRGSRIDPPLSLCLLCTAAPRMHVLPHTRCAHRCACCLACAVRITRGSMLLLPHTRCAHHTRLHAPVASHSMCASHADPCSLQSVCGHSLMCVLV